jgi:ankyrin repeat protein
MPPKSKKSKQGEVTEDFDDMLAGFRAADLANAPPNDATQSAADNTPANAARAQPSEVFIIAAIRAGDLSKLRRWHRQGVEWSAEHLCVAVEMDSIAVMRCLVEELGADANTTTDAGATPVFVASWNGKLGLVRYLVKKTLGADVNKANAAGASLLYLAAQEGHLEVVRCLVEEFGADVNQALDDGSTPLMIAARQGYLAVVRCLGMEHGADINRVNHEGTTALIDAAQNGHVDVVQCLVAELGADVNKADEIGSTPLMVAAHLGHLVLVQYLAREHAADVNKSDHVGATALIVAAQGGQLSVVQCLVEEFGADVNLATHNGRTALMMASLKKQDKVVRWLTRHGADIQASAVYGKFTAVDASRIGGAPLAQMEYLEAKAHCSNPGCSGAGFKKCTGCKQARYCGRACQLAHWKAHKGDCKANQKA